MEKDKHLDVSSTDAQMARPGIRRNIRPADIIADGRSVHVKFNAMDAAASMNEMRRVVTARLGDVSGRPDAFIEGAFGAIQSSGIAVNQPASAPLAATSSTTAPLLLEDRQLPDRQEALLRADAVRTVMEEQLSKRYLGVEARNARDAASVGHAHENYEKRLVSAWKQK